MSSIEIYIVRLSQADLSFSDGEPADSPIRLLKENYPPHATVLGEIEKRIETGRREAITSTDEIIPIRQMTAGRRGIGVTSDSHGTTRIIITQPGGDPKARAIMPTLLKELDIVVFGQKNMDSREFIVEGAITRRRGQLGSPLMPRQLVG